LGLRRLEFGHVVPYLSDSSQTCNDGQTALQHDLGRLDVAVQQCMAATAFELPDVQSNLIKRSTAMALLR